MGIKAALWTALPDQEHRTKHWLQIVAIPNAPVAEITQGVLNWFSSLEDLRAPSRSPRPHQQAKTLSATTGSLFLAPPKGEPKGNKRGNKGKQQRRYEEVRGHFGVTGGSQAPPSNFSQQGGLFPVSESYLQDGQRLQVDARSGGDRRYVDYGFSIAYTSDIAGSFVYLLTDAIEDCGWHMSV